jgi:hypothetical protein
MGTDGHRLLQIASTMEGSSELAKTSVLSSKVFMLVSGWWIATVFFKLSLQFKIFIITM